MQVTWGASHQKSSKKQILLDKSLSLGPQGLTLTRKSIQKLTVSTTPTADAAVPPTIISRLDLGAPSTSLPASPLGISLTEQPGRHLSFKI